MDSDSLQRATKRWVEAGILDEETAVAIREFEREHGGGATGARSEGSDDKSEGSDRLVAAISVMGAVLVGAGLFLYLAANWEDIPTAIRTLVLVATPLAAIGGGLALARGRAPRVGHGCGFLGAAFLGPSLFLLSNLYAPDLATEWILLAWALGAIPTGQVFESRLTTALGLLVALVATGFAATPDAAPFVVAFVGTLVVAAGIFVEPGGKRLAGVHRLVGLVPVLGVLLMVGLEGGDYGFVDLWPDLTLAGAAVGAAIAIGYAGYHRFQETVTDADALAVAAPGAATWVVLLLVALSPPIPELAAFLLVHLTLLALLVALVVVAVGWRSRAVVNLVAVAFLLQVVTFLVVAVPDALSGAIALVVAGLVLLAVGFGLEHGRRQLFERMNLG